MLLMLAACTVKWPGKVFPVCVSSSIWVSLLPLLMHGWLQSHLKGVPWPHQIHLVQPPVNKTLTFDCSCPCRSPRHNAVPVPSISPAFLALHIPKNFSPEGDLGVTLFFSHQSFPGRPCTMLRVQCQYLCPCIQGLEQMVVVEGRASSPCLMSAVRHQHWAGGSFSMEGAPPLEVLSSHGSYSCRGCP